MLYDEFIRILKSFFSDKKTLNLEVEYSAFSGYLAIIAVFCGLMSYTILIWGLSAMHTDCVCEKVNLATYLKNHVNPDCDEFSQNCYVIPDVEPENRGNINFNLESNGTIRLTEPKK